MTKDAAFCARRARYRALVRHPSALLLGAQLLEILVYPALEGTRTAQVAVSMMAALVLLATLRLIHYTKGRVWVAAMVAILAIGMNVLAGLWDAPALNAAQLAVRAVLYFYAGACLIGYILADRHPTNDELFAAAATFTLFVWAFAQLLMLCQWLQPSAFGVDVSNPRDWSEVMFLSFALFTNTGIGDVIPVTGASRAIANLEMFSGVMYLALVVSRLIGLVSNEKPK